MGQSPEIPERTAGHDKKMNKRIAEDESGKIGSKWGWGMWICGGLQTTFIMWGRMEGFGKGRVEVAMTHL